MRLIPEGSDYNMVLTQSAPYLQETKDGYIFEAEDPIFTKAGFSYLEFLKWIHDRYENKEFSWQSVVGDVE